MSKDYIKAVTPIELKLGTTFRFVGSSELTRCEPGVCMVVRVIGGHDGLIFGSDIVRRWGWTPLEGPDAGRIYKFNEVGPEQIEVVDIADVEVLTTC